MANPDTPGKVDYRMLGMLSNLVICSRCLRSGRVTPVPQLLSARHKPRSLCTGCTPASRSGVRRGLARLARIW